MRITSKGRVTIPIAVRRQLGLDGGDEVRIVVDGDSARVIRVVGDESAGRRLARRLRGSGSSGMATDEIMELLRGGVG
ncbi:AbrB/MazE/SpoVT family DNA-binding domain-containing protein [Kribbella sp. NBC_01245]|uniref:AbrB/MazE/SpoVT family DNA-binding domain-containing protein n=1 Tax=Kribbella sp. NBC_01245 TaxID=2903578 RepID=UPI002E281B7F|nr:AbrB/MazE/SpoVT family DNA-binding domain-containing protein [Kribbella sp. NBC_01245]